MNWFAEHGLQIAGLSLGLMLVLIGVRKQLLGRAYWEEVLKEHEEEQVGQQEVDRYAYTHNYGDLGLLPIPPTYISPELPCRKCGGATKHHIGGGSKSPCRWCPACKHYQHYEWGEEQFGMTERVWSSWDQHNKEQFRRTHRQSKTAEEYVRCPDCNSSIEKLQQDRCRMQDPYAWWCQTCNKPFRSWVPAGPIAKVSTYDRIKVPEPAPWVAPPLPCANCGGKTKAATGRVSGAPCRHCSTCGPKEYGLFQHYEWSELQHGMKPERWAQMSAEDKTTWRKTHGQSKTAEEYVRCPNCKAGIEYLQRDMSTSAEYAWYCIACYTGFTSWVATGPIAACYTDQTSMRNAARRRAREKAEHEHQKLDNAQHVT